MALLQPQLSKNSLGAEGDPTGEGAPRCRAGVGTQALQEEWEQQEKRQHEGKKEYVPERRAKRRPSILKPERHASIELGQAASSCM